MFLYVYKDKVKIPPLSMIDDVACLSACGVQSIESNAFINAKFEQKKLQLNIKKCKQIHIKGNSKDTKNCPQLHAHDSLMIKIGEDKYFGDIISSDGKNTKNMKHKASIGMGSMTSIMTILNS